MYASLEDRQHILILLKRSHPLKAVIKTKHPWALWKTGTCKASLIALVPAAHTNIVFLWNARSSCHIIPRWWHVINAAAHLDMDTCVCRHKITNANCFCDLIRKVITCSVSRFVDVWMKCCCTTAGPGPQHYFKQKKTQQQHRFKWVSGFISPLVFVFLHLHW